ncbi:SGNH/GDSL hydrolase family protein [Paraburkholderia kururiensis]|uniref:SGNH/GDSL hydrolase family protein n=1 Tax=Paraburkholderia kururiensis TaxID=984307 RepID=A0ABZ0WS79_9BURK|nr:SGNH/GDSL hydrolase family protein [Paraburkholderia kururiensis]WQD80095.1 SGNH/GDSL hydrolase family protein [Paraburkholderia kururiensis]
MRRRATTRSSRRIALAVVACVAAWSAGTTPAPAASSVDATRSGDVVIEAYGDSTTLGISCADGRCGPRPQNAVTYLQDDLRAAHGERVSVANYGIGGTMATQLLDGSSRNPPWKARLATSPAQIVTINYGINEVMRNQTPEQFYAAETALVKDALAAGKLPVLQTSNPMPDGRLNAKLGAMVAMTRRVAQEQHVPLVDHYASIQTLADWKGMMSDGAHPKPELYRVKAGHDFEVIDPLVQKLLREAPTASSAANHAASPAETGRERAAPHARVAGSQS